eukprot:m.24211 g.24211  ORF g.24211 m.24211 type:complete len:201 (+) comp14502_c0_seq1:69-671(+)
MPPPPAFESYTSALGPRGVTTVEVYLDYACPYSKKMYEMLFLKVFPMYKDKIRLVFKHQVQPWHAQSMMIHEVALAVKKVGGLDGFFKFSTEVLAVQSDVCYDDVCVNLSKVEICNRLADVAEKACGLDKATLLDLVALKPEGMNSGSVVTDTLKHAIKEGRQNGIHVSPTTVVNGLIVDTSSGWDEATWKEFLDPLVGV